MNRTGFLSEIGLNLYKLRTLSKTNNLTIIFSINYKNDQKTYCNNSFEDFLI